MLFGPQLEVDKRLVHDRNSRAKAAEVGVVKRRGKALDAVSKARKIRTPKKRLEDTRCIYPSVWASLKFKSSDTKRTRSAFLSASQSKQPVCVTNADSFAAAWIVAMLLERGYKVRATVPVRNEDVNRLNELPQAAKNLTIVETTLLTPELCDLAVEGCEYVIHTGTPASCMVRDPVSEAKDPWMHTVANRIHLIVPAMINFMKACVRARVKKIVLTSSVAALCDSVGANTVVNDLCWNTESSIDKNPHFFALKLAEEKAWQLIEQENMELVTICPGALMGPSICGQPSIPPGNQVVYDLITGAYAALVDLNWAVTDVRDCANAHILAMEHPDARGRYICVNRTVWLRDIVEVLRTNGYSGRDLPLQVGLPNWVARLPAYAQQLGQVGAALYADHPSNSQPSPYLSDRIVDVMGLHFREVKDTIIETAGDLLKWKWIKPWAEDCEAPECAICGAQFSFLRRKHHCRECGRIICADCSMSRAVVEGLSERARLCDQCVQTSIPELIENVSTKMSSGAIMALESLMENPENHDLITRCHGIPILIEALHSTDEEISYPAAGTFLALSLDVASALQMVLEGAVLHMLEVDQTTDTWRQCLQALRNIWRQINRTEFRKMLHSVSRVSTDAASGPLKANILLTFVHMMEPNDVVDLLKEGLMDVFYFMLRSLETYPRCAAAHAIMRLIPDSYNPDTSIDIPPFHVDDHEELLTISALSDIQFLVKGHIAPINAHKIVLFVRNAYFKNMFGSSTTTTKRVIEIDNCSYNVFSMILRFLYTGKLTIDENSSQDLLRAASFYQVTVLQKRIEKFLSDRININNVVELLCLANECHAESLRRSCMPFLLKNIHAVVKLDSFAEHHDWASHEILEELSNILGSAWQGAYTEVKLKTKAKPNTITIPKPLVLASPLRKSYSPAFKPLQELSPPSRPRLASEESLAEGFC
ncbi:dihydroflavonol-4-reductase [Thraustotheca clavata]|uniref:Dihydroflavonol-4-reductase n=1 Tax=Thraustotheca clavata TaxID=74557 RepID=A0A1W0A1E2_9STRA|nr:dihydroflavonol-4-reductase [Thraustotheca clavata]